MYIRNLFEQSRRLDDFDIDKVYEIFRDSYMKETGQSWSKEKFISRARNWTFYGSEDGFVAVRIQRSGMKKLVGVAGNAKAVGAALQELISDGGPIWGAVSDRLARGAKRYGFIAPHTIIGGPTVIRALVGIIPPAVFGGYTPVVTKDGGLSIDYDDVGSTVKYMIGNKEYFKQLTGLPQAKEALLKVPGLGTFLKFIGVNQ